MQEISLQPSALEIEHAFEMLLPKLQNLVGEYYKKNYANLIQSEIQVRKGRKYWKLVSVGQYGSTSSTCVYAFIRREDGAILRPATFNKPELRVKNPVYGYITDDDCLQWFSSTGVRYAAY